MPSITTIQSTFNGGEFSPRLLGQVNIEKYQAAVETLRNFIVTPQGGIIRRSGSKFIYEVADSDNFTRLVPFVYSTTQSYVLEFSNNLIRFYTGSSDGNEGILETSPGSGTPYSIATTYTTAQIPDLDFAQSADVLYVTHPDHLPRKLQRLGATNWTISDVELLGPYLPINTSTTTLKEVATGGGAGDGYLQPSTEIFSAADIGRSFRIVTSDDPSSEVGAGPWGDGIITSFEADAGAPADRVGITWFSEVDVPEPTTNWRLGRFQIDDAPSAVSFYEQRLCFAGQKSDPQTFHGSMSGSFEDFSPDDGTTLTGGVQDDSAISYTLASGEVNPIRWMAPTRVLVLGTDGGIWPVQGATVSTPITPTAVNVRRANAFGTINVAPVAVDDAIVHISRNSRKLRSLAYSLGRDNYVSEDLSILSEHLLQGGITELAYQPTPHSVIWCVSDVDDSPLLTYDREQKIFAWTRLRMGGSLGTGSARIESVATVPSPSGTYDQTWVVVKRDIGTPAVEKRYVELFEPDFPLDGELEDAFFVDSGVFKNYGTPTSGELDMDLAHLAGETVQILADGAPIPDQEVSGTGKITLTNAATKVTAGLGYTSDMLTLPLNTQVPNGTSQGKTARISHATLRLNTTLGGKVGVNFTDMNDLIFRDFTVPYDEPPSLFTGDYEALIDGPYTTKPQVAIRQDQPLPMTLLAIILRTDVETR